MRCGPLNFWQEILNMPDPRSCYECRCLILKLKNLYLNCKINLQWTLHLWETLFWLGLRRQSRGTQFPEAFSYGPKHHFFSLSCKKQVLGLLRKLTMKISNKNICCSVWFEAFASLAPFQNKPGKKYLWYKKLLILYPQVPKEWGKKISAKF